MPRSKLTDKQWQEMERRLLDGEKPADLAREYEINRSAITRRFAQQHKSVKSVAHQLVSAEAALRDLPVAQQLTALNLAEELRAISRHLCSAANYGAMTAHRLSGIASQKASALYDDEVDSEQGMNKLKAIAGLTRVANESAEIGLNLLRANKDAVDALNRSAEDPLPPAVITVERKNARQSQ